MQTAMTAGQAGEQFSAMDTKVCSQGPAGTNHESATTGEPEAVVRAHRSF
jgi:hypothetical protein